MICPTCLSDVPDDAQVCHLCGQTLTGRREDSGETVYCLHCGAKCQATSLYCESCGRLLSEPPMGSDPGALEPARVGARRFEPREWAELISETFRVFRSNFQAFIYIAAISLIPSIVLSFLAPVPSSAGTFILLAFFLVLSMVLGVLVQGAMVYGVALHYLNRQVRVAECYRRAWNRVTSLVLGMLLIGLALGAPLALLIVILPPLALLWIVVLPYFLVRWYFFAQAIMVEGHRSTASLRRSAQLVQGTAWRVFGIGVAFVLVGFGVSVVLSIPGGVISLASPILGNILLTTAAVVTTPILGIGSTVVYFDLRARKEGYDLSRLAAEMGV